MNEAQHSSPKNSSPKNPFFLPFVFILIFAILEFWGGIWTQSLALLSDAWHMFSDVFALGLAMLASYFSNKAKADNTKSQAEMIASILNAVLMLAVTVWIVLEAVERLNSPRPVAGHYVIVIAFVGLVVNLIVAKNLHQYEGDKGLNHQAAFLHVMGDILGSVAAIVAGVVISLTGWLPIDPILSLFISLLLLVGTFNLVRNIRQTLSGKRTHPHHDHHH